MQTTREQLVEVAAHLVDENGPATGTPRKVGAGAGLSHSASYKHFAGKRDLLATVAAVELDLRAARITRAVNHFPGTQAVGHAARAYLGRPRLFRPISSSFSGPWGEQDHDEVGVERISCRLPARKGPF